MLSAAFFLTLGTAPEGGFAQQEQERATKRHKKRKKSINSDDSALLLCFLCLFVADFSFVGQSTTPCENYGPEARPPSTFSF
jgi:hypothetical protein